MGSSTNGLKAKVCPLKTNNKTESGTTGPFSWVYIFYIVYESNFHKNEYVWTCVGSGNTLIKNGNLEIN